jgi:pimeloyl-ACP methyl ester carboxylesterase
VSSWAAHAWAVADVVEAETVSIVGNSMGARVALAMALSQPSRVARLVLMGARVKPSPTPASQMIMTYEPGLAAMERLIRECFVCDQTIVTDEIIRRRYEASAAPGAHEAFRAAFSPQARANEPALDEGALRSVTTPSLVLHGREDRVVPAENSWDLASWLPNADLQVLGNCGHWLHMERPAWFERTLQDFLGGVEHANPRVS